MISEQGKKKGREEKKREGKKKSLFYYKIDTIFLGLQSCLLHQKKYEISLQYTHTKYKKRLFIYLHCFMCKSPWFSLL